jgi:hypothetical protein
MQLQINRRSGDIHKGKPKPCVLLAPDPSNLIRHAAACEFLARRLPGAFGKLLQIGNVYAFRAPCLFPRRIVAGRSLIMIVSLKVAISADPEYGGASYAGIPNQITSVLPQDPNLCELVARLTSGFMQGGFRFVPVI